MDGFRSYHGATAATLVTNDTVTSVDSKQHCAALFAYVSKAFDTVNHKLRLVRLSSIGPREIALSWFRNCLSERTKCVSVEIYSSPFITATTGVLQGSIFSFHFIFCF